MALRSLSFKNLSRSGSKRICPIVEFMVFTDSLSAPSSHVNDGSMSIMRDITNGLQRKVGYSVREVFPKEFGLNSESGHVSCCPKSK